MLTIALLLAQVSPPEPAPAPAPVCSATDADLPAALAGWTRPGSRVQPGRSFETATVDAAAANPVKMNPPKRAGRSATVMFTIKTAGSYRIALDQPGWIDVRPVSGSAPLVSVGHGHGPACSTIRKLVAFELTAQAYYLDLTGLQKSRARVMLVPGR